MSTMTRQLGPERVSSQQYYGCRPFYHNEGIFGYHDTGRGSQFVMISVYPRK